MLDPGPGASAVVEDIPLPNVTPWTRKESLSYEKEALGLYASGHPLEEYAKSIQALTRIDSGNIAESAAHGDTIGMGGMVIELAIRTTKKGDRFALFRLEDQFGSVKVVCWPETFNRYKNLISDDQVLLVRGKLELSDEGEATIIAAEMQQLDAARTNAARGVLVQIPECAVSVQGIETLCDLLSRAQGTASVFIEVGLEDGLTVRLRPQQFLRVKVSDELLAGIQAIDQQWKVNMIMGE